MARYRDAIITALLGVGFCAAAEKPKPRDPIGREVAVPRHLADDDEFRIPLSDLLAHGRKLFGANWTDQEGGGRPMMKGNGRALSDPTNPLTGTRGFNRISAPDANSCAGCHNLPYGIWGGGGDFVTNVFVLGQRFDFVTFERKEELPTVSAFDEDLQPVNLRNVANQRATTGMFGAGYLEMLARQITEDLQRIRDTVGRGESKALVSKGISFGTVTRNKDGVWDTSRVEGLPRVSLLTPTPIEPPTLVVRPWHQAGNVVSLREFTNNAYNQHHGIQTTERFGVGNDPDGDGVPNELTRADVTAVTVFQATLPVPGRVIPNDPEIEAAVLRGERTFERIGCASCHVASLTLDRQAWVYSEPNPYNPAGNLRTGETKSFRIDLATNLLPAPRLVPDKAGTVSVAAYTDFKLHDIGEDGEAEPLDMNQTNWSPKFKGGNRKFLTKRLWGAANEPPYFHHGLFTTLRQAILAHAGEALSSRVGFQKLSELERDSLVEFMKSLQVLPPGTKDLVVDENYRAKRWPPPGGSNAHP